MTRKTWIIFAIMCIAIIGGLIALSRSSKIDVSHVDVNAIQAASTKNGGIADHVYGNAKSKVIIIEYGDYECPGCATAAPILSQVSQKYKDKIGFIFRNFPLTSIHPNALAAATAVEAAGLQGKFWEMHNAIYTNQSDWENLSGTDRTTYFVNQAKTLGLNTTKLQDTINNNDNIQKKIDFDRALGSKLGITGTPTIYVNGKDYSSTRYNGSHLSTDTNDDYVWSNATAFDSLVLQPAMKVNGISY